MGFPSYRQIDQIGPFTPYNKPMDMDDPGASIENIIASRNVPLELTRAGKIQQGFQNIAGDDIQKYVTSIKPGGYRESHPKHGKAPWSSDLFTGDGMSPTEQIPVKESVDLQRWQKLAGILKD